MTKNKLQPGLVHITVTAGDIESAIRSYIIQCNPEFEMGWIVNPEKQDLEVLDGVTFYAQDTFLLKPPLPLVLTND